ncbi:hypothetical protein [Chryseobacterium limigenitum]|uniref:Uncharacterized protein n=1 Tax=Chryseobacterium limigenitum TaxID=1612149 RepID=A0A1K2IWV3_9FLAO|nr:hypothetical protein [Chryseobacterium limigenitum]SFZ96908.1 hypothetical protein SAMN05216324_1302 [Chryseobacterium limigenitum]
MKKKLFRILGVALVILLLLFAYKAVSVLAWTQNANKNFKNLTLLGQLVDENNKNVEIQGKIFLTKTVGSDDSDLDPIGEQQVDILTVNNKGEVNTAFLPLQRIDIDSVVVSGYRLKEVKKESYHIATKDYDTIQMKFVLTKQ